MTDQQIERLIQKSEEMIEKVGKDRELKQIYKDVNFRRIIEDGKAELLYRETDFRDLTPEEYGNVGKIFA